MNKLKQSYWKFLILGAGIILLAFSAYFALERIVSADTADYLVHLINTKTFYFGSKRFIAIPTQVLPLLFVYLKLPFTWIVYAYSTSLMAFHIGILGIIVLALKDIKTGLVLVLAHLLGGALLFYYPISEYQMGLSLSLLLYAYAKNKVLHQSFSWLSVGISVILLTTVIYSHPLSVLFVGFLLGNLFITNWPKISWKIVVLLGAASLTIFLSKYLFFSIVNDSQNIELIEGLSFFPSHAFKILWNELTSYHYLFLVLCLFCVVYLASIKKYQLLAFTIGYSYICLFLFLSKQGHSTYHWYAAHIYQSLYYMPILVFIEQWRLGFFDNKWIRGAALIFIVVGLIQLFQRSSFNKSRIENVAVYLKAAQEADINKGIIDYHHPFNNYKNWLWAMEYESIVISKFRYNETRTVIYKLKEDFGKECEPVQNEFLTVWGSFPLEEFNEAYFQFDESPYQVVEMDE